MSRAIRVVAFAAFLSAITGCAARVPMAPTHEDELAKQFKAPVDRANLYVYRNETMGFAVGMTVMLDGAWLGDTAAQTYLHLPIEPGPHEVASKTENTTTVSFTAESGKNYFVWQEVKMGFAAARSKLHFVDEAEGRKGVAECSLAKHNPPPARSSPSAGCSKDADCKGTRICEAGACVDPKAAAAIPVS